jgi:hypothetical protein
MFSLRQRFLYSGGARRTILRGERSNLPHSATRIFSFVFQYTHEGSPTFITDGFRQMVIFDQPADVEILYPYLSTFLEQLKTRFMEKVSLLVANLQMFFSEKHNRLAAVRAAQFLLTNFALLNLQFIFGLAKIFSILYTHASRKCGDVFKTNVNADCLTSLRKIRRLIFLNREDNKPAINLFLNQTGFYFAFDETRQRQSYKANFRMNQIVANEFDSRLWIGERVIARFIFKSWKAGFLIPFQTSLKESVTSSHHSSEHILRNLQLEKSKFFSNCSNLFQLIGLMKIVNRLVVLFEGIASFLESGVIECPAKCKHMIKQKKTVS